MSLKVSPECQKQIDRCLENCPTQKSGEVNAGIEHPDAFKGSDNRSICEKQCHNRCR
jgi:hypothetical protein